MSTTTPDFEAAQVFMREHAIAAWLLYDFRGSNLALPRLLGRTRNTTRRVFLLVPARGAPVLLCSVLDRSQFADVGLRVETYVGWKELIGWLAGALAGLPRVAMEYAPGCTLPIVSLADAGTIELVRALGSEVVSSANLIQLCVATWSATARANHDVASARVARIKDEAFAFVRESLHRPTPVTELDVQQFILRRFADQGLETPSPPICAVNAHSGDPHYELGTSTPSPIRRGDWILLDLWARLPGDENVFSDITWVATAAAAPSTHEQRVFETVRAARDAAIDRLRAAWAAGEPLQGWQLDDAARAPLIASAFAAHIRHRTGHSLSPGPTAHGLGVNLDNLETHDTRLVLPGLGFTIEPGLYLPEFGVRLETNIFMDATAGPTITTPLQTEIVTLG